MQNIRIGLTHSHPCSYLPDQQERVAIAIDQSMHDPEQYEILLANGFRRSGKTIYKPHCDSCKACQPLRLPVRDFQPSKSQKRLLKKAAHLTWELKPSFDPGWYELYKQYICQRHRAGSMYPPKRLDFMQFATCDWLTTSFLHIYEYQHLIAVAITDILPDSASAFYTFYDPESTFSLGTLAVLIQIQACTTLEKQWLYLGYQIDQCTAMNYKTRFRPHQRLVNQRWQG
jgi:arginine-tRNA-protein transferase